MYYILKYLFYFPINFLWLKKINGVHNIPKGSFILAANHSSYLDFILLFIFFPRKISFLAAEKFFNNIFWRPIMQMTGQIKVDRLNHDKTFVYNSVDNVFRSGGILGIFPEGTRSRDGNMGKYYNGVARFAYKYKVPVLPIGITGTFDAWPPQNKFPKIKKCFINIGKPILINTDDFEKETKNIMYNILDLCKDNK